MINRYQALIIGGSAGSFQVVLKILESLNRATSFPVFVIMHRLKNVRHGFAEALHTRSALTVYEPYDKEIIRGGRVYLAPSNFHLIIEREDYISLTTDEVRIHSRPSIDYAFTTAADHYGNTLLAVLLSGANKDGTAGMDFIKKQGGTTIVQDPDSCEVPTMTLAVTEEMSPDHILDPEQICKFIKSLT